MSEEESTKSYRERLDPDGETGKMVRAFANPVALAAVRLLAGSEQAAELKRVSAGYEALMAGLEDAAETLNDLGWIVFDLSPAEAYARAAKLVRVGKTDEAEQLLVEEWNDGNALAFVNRVVSIYSGHPEMHWVGLERQNLLQEAVDAHRAGHYAAAIGLALAQIDGIVFDMTGSDARGFFARVGDRAHLTDEVTLAGHPRGLRYLNELFNRGVKATQRTESLGRHGIMHGRALGYDTRLNSTKALVAVISVIEWARPIGQAAAATAAHEREARYAGSDELDEEGRRLDRRGFVEGKFLLQEIQLYEHGRRQHHGAYTEDVEDLLLSGTAKTALTLEGARFEILVSDDSYHAFYVTPTGYVFGVAGEGGDYNNSWQFAEATVPQGPPALDERWHHVARDPAPREW